jgi:hypothetical protein
MSAEPGIHPGVEGLKLRRIVQSLGWVRIQAPGEALGRASVWNAHTREGKEGHAES